MTEPDFSFEDPRLRRFYEYWLSKCRPGRLPARADIDPVEIPDLLPWIMLIDPVPDAAGIRFRFRLVGTGLVARAGRDATGRYYDEMLSKRDVARFAAIYNDVIRTGRPHHFHADLDINRMEGREHIRYERLLCPLASDGVTVDMLVAIVAFLDAPK
ncbi:MAG TPA: PAS domain-containing protein [Alphaproteobacteria bacterium]|jgi:hypothetical protein|nr:PAS domain-containing protein [Alphaproteobacteria bacterium]